MGTAASQSDHAVGMFKDSGCQACIKYWIPINGSLYEVYCYFDSDSAWTLLHSYSYENRFLYLFRKPLYVDIPVSENALTWSG